MHSSVHGTTGLTVQSSSTLYSGRTKSSSQAGYTPSNATEKPAKLRQTRQGTTADTPLPDTWYKGILRTILLDY